jgi:hypothetical protein
MIEAPAPGLTRRLDVWDVDPAHSSVRFDVRHALSRLRGRFDTDRAGRDARLRGEASCTPTASRTWCSALSQVVGGLLVGRTVQVELEIQVVRRRG